jgi:hypothetical protein
LPQPQIIWRQFCLSHLINHDFFRIWLKKRSFCTIPVHQYLPHLERFSITSNNLAQCPPFKKKKNFYVWSRTIEKCWSSAIMILLATFFLYWIFCREEQAEPVVIPPGHVWVESDAGPGNQSFTSC